MKYFKNHTLCQRKVGNNGNDFILLLYTHYYQTDLRNKS